MRGRDRVLVLAWPVLLALAICGPLLTPGFVVGYDMVFVPDLALRTDLLGGSTALPRAVPSDAVVAVLDEVAGGMALNKLVLLAIPLGGGWGMVVLMRTVRPATGPAGWCAAATFFVWNPYVAERLALGHWALLLGYAALPWLLRSVVRIRRGDPAAWPGAVIALAASALTASGGLVAFVLTAAVLCWPGRDRGARRVTGGVIASAVLLNAPWIVAGLSRGATAVSDRAAVEAFAARDEGYGGVLPTLLTLGGIWNADVVPGSRGTAVAVAGGFLLLAASVAGTVMWWRDDRATAVPVTAAAGVVLGLAVLGVLAPRFLAWLVASVPGIGLVRDGPRYLGPLVLLEAVGLGLAAGWAVTAVTAVAAVRRRGRWIGHVMAGTAVLVPVAVLPDLAWGGGLAVSHYPSDWPAARAAVAGDPRPGDVMPWPFEAYRAPAWNDYRPVLDPMPRYVTRPAVVPDELVVSGRRLAGEDPRSAAIATALRAGRDATSVVLAQGVGWIVVDREAAARSGRPDPTVAVRGSPVFEGPAVAVYAVAGQPAPRPRLATGWTIGVIAAWSLAVGIVLAGLAGLAGGARRRLA